MYFRHKGATTLLCAIIWWVKLNVKDVSCHTESASLVTPDTGQSAWPRGFDQDNQVSTPINTTASKKTHPFISIASTRQEQFVARFKKRFILRFSSSPLNSCETSTKNTNMNNIEFMEGFDKSGPGGLFSCSF